MSKEAVDDEVLGAVSVPDEDAPPEMPCLRLRAFTLLLRVSRPSPRPTHRSPQSLRRSAVMRE